jgi:hypothetical protein|tara:strand:- start:6697 stop:8337 length:1641 start_codon:yes stop_codon:yes gene_type:complete
MALCSENIVIPRTFSEEVATDNLKREYGLSPIFDVKSEVNICSEIFQGPKYTSNFTKLTTGLTENSVGVFNITNSDASFIYSFTGNQETLSAYTGDFKFQIYERELGFIPPNVIFPNGTSSGSTQIFGNSLTYSASTAFSAITNNNYSGSTSLTNLLKKDQEYILNSNFSFLKKECFYKDWYTVPNLGNEYDLDSTLFFVTLIDPESPILGPFVEPTVPNPQTLTVNRVPTNDNLSQTYVFGVPSGPETTATTCKLVNETLVIDSIPSSGDTFFSISSTPSPNTLIVAVNGLTLSSIDYTIVSGTTIILSQPLDPLRDVITASYLDCLEDLDTIYSEQYQVLSAITSGATSAVTTTDKVYYNTSKNKYEYYLEYSPNEAETQMTLYLNGVRLTYGIDYYMSITVENRVIFNSISLSINDLIYIVYATDKTLEGDYEIVTGTSNLDWRIINPTVVNEVLNGNFLVQISESNDPNFTSTGVTTGITVNYFNDVTGYSVGLPTTLEANKDYIWRVNSKKVYSGILDNIFITNNVSRVGKFSTNNKINSY